MKESETRVEEMVARRIAEYRRVQDRAGVSFRCLDPEAEEFPPVATQQADEEGAVTVRIQGPLDEFWGFDVRALIRDLDHAKPTSINLLIESPGGYLRDGLALYNDLRARSRDGVSVNAEARGVVASAAVLPFLASDDRSMSTGTQLMVHNPWSVIFLAGTADDIESHTSKAIKALRSSEKILHEVMVKRTGSSHEKVEAWLKAETWFSPDEAKEAGFSTEVIEDAGVDQDEEAQAMAQRIMAAWRLRNVVHFRQKKEEVA